MRASLILTLIFLLLAGGLSVLFFYQNRAFEAEVGLNLGFWAGRLKAPVPVPTLVLSALFGGLLVGWLAGSLRSFGLARRVRQLESYRASDSIRQDNNW